MVLCMPSSNRMTNADGTACRQKAIKLSVKAMALIKNILNRLINRKLWLFGAQC
ncbi:hypothetical protein D3C72_2600730 [compost metagenome]